ncbi:MAG: NAD(P)H-dependent glycerol-3-phosphate dehydrogenase [Sulfurospirillaceae bacterium]|nr:NAD(P)H-dependent glycerol-3-phosphate dehydrogenase [Sulfurospirillaceae bacterium]
MSIAVIGAGKWGSALHFAFSQNFSCKITSKHKRDIPDFVSLEKALACEYLVMAIPAQVVGTWLRDHFTFNNQKILVAAKGIEQKSGKFLNEIFSEYVPVENLSYLSGPSFAYEVMQSLPTAIVINSTNMQLASKFSSFFPDFMKTYVSDDVIGAEVCGAYKNVIAIASGICAGLNLGQNARASLISRGLVEMARFGRYFGAEDDTFLGLSGAGDLFLSASSELSRNYRVGLELAKERKIDDILKELGEVAEGVHTTDAIIHLSLESGIYVPIATEVQKIIKGKNPNLSLRDLLE